MFVDDCKDITNMNKEYEQQIEELYTEGGKLTTQLSWLKKIWPLRNEKFRLLEWESPDLSIQTQVDL
ncbi:hypothetical protein BK147_09260 [Paenibacillus sp. FSL R7-0337]|nr:hypothetical protein BK147_09260 [Paenibacillus sp. FSL R7-0337]